MDVFRHFNVPIIPTHGEVPSDGLYCYSDGSTNRFTEDWIKGQLGFVNTDEVTYYGVSSCGSWGNKVTNITPSAVSYKDFLFKIIPVGVMGYYSVEIGVLGGESHILEGYYKPSRMSIVLDRVIEFANELYLKLKIDHLVVEGDIREISDLQFDPEVGKWFYQGKVVVDKSYCQLPIHNYYVVTYFVKA